MVGGCAVPTQCSMDDEWSAQIQNRFRVRVGCAHHSHLENRSSAPVTVLAHRPCVRLLNWDFLADSLRSLTSAFSSGPISDGHNSQT